MTGERTPSSRSRGRRVNDTRKQNYEEAADVFAVVAWNEADHGNAGVLGIEGDVDYGSAMFVEGYERIHLAVDIDFGAAANDMTMAFIVAQGSPVGGASAEHWYDLYADEAETGVLVRKVWELPLVIGLNGKTRIAWHEQRRVFRWMRFKLFVDGTAFVDATAKLRASRVMDSM
jgi:hypothetical protein